MMWPWGISMSWWWIAWMVIFWGGIIALIVLAIKKLAERGNATTTQNPLDIAKERYARGEIPKEEFEQIKKDLS